MGCNDLGLRHLLLGCLLLRLADSWAELLLRRTAGLALLGVRCVEE
jgi:hypothetical protein